MINSLSLEGHIISHRKNSSMRTSHLRVYNYLYSSICLALLAGFVVVAATQAYQLNSLSSEAEAIAFESARISSQREIIMREYISLAESLYNSG